MKENNKIFEEQASILREQMEQEVAAAHASFAEREGQIIQGKEDNLVLNQTHYDEIKSRVALVFKETPQLTWAAYQSAEAIRVRELKIAEDACKAAVEDININYLKQLSDSKLEFEQKTTEIDCRYTQKIAILKDSLLNLDKVALDAKNKYHHFTREAGDQYYSTKCAAIQQFNRQGQEAFDLYCKLYKIAGKKLSDVIDDVRLESYRMLAHTVGLDDVSNDVLAYVTKPDDPYAKIQPLLSYTDLRRALSSATKIDVNSRIIEIFYRILQEPLTLETQLLREAVDSLDLALNSQMFKHTWSFSAPSNPLRPRTVYVEILKNSVTFTVICPYGESITKSYDENSTVGLKPIKEYIKSGQMMSYIKSNFESILLDIYCTHRASSFDAFSKLRETVDGFKEYLTETIYIYNKEMLREAGFAFFRLTKTHLCRAPGFDYCINEETPFSILNKETSETQHLARLQFEATKSQAEEVCKNTILEAKQIMDSACSLAKGIYEEEMAVIAQISSENQTSARDDLYPKLGENKANADEMSSTGAESSIKMVLALEKLDQVVSKISPSSIKKSGFLMLNGKAVKKPSRFVSEKHKLSLDRIDENIYSDEDEDDFDAEISAIFEQGLDFEY